jgi:hypothetical protein
MIPLDANVAYPVHFKIKTKDLKKRKATVGKKSNP